MNPRLDGQTDGSPQATVEVSGHGRILTVTLNHPPDHAVTPEMLELVDKALDLLDENARLDLAIFTGQGRVFSKGFDVGVIHSWADHSRHGDALRRYNRVYSRIAASAKPTLAAINGHCFGGGLELALACHFRLCVEKVRLGLPELARGLLPGLGGIHRLVRLIGRSKALELIALGDMITAEEALRLNVVNRVVPRENFTLHVQAFADALLAVDPALVREVIRLTDIATSRSEDDCVIETIESCVRLVPPKAAAAAG